MAYRDTVLAHTPKIYFQFEESNGALVNSGSQTGLTIAKVGAPVWATGADGRGFTYDGDDAFTVTTTFDFTSAKTFAIEAWIKISPTTGYNTIVRRSDGNNHVILRVRGTDVGSNIGLLEGFFGNANGTRTLLSTARIDDGLWHHVVLGGTSSNLNLYVDGAVVSQGALPSGGAAIATPIQIGRSGDGTEYFKGTIDEVAIYDSNIAGTVTAHASASRTPVSTTVDAGYVAQASTASSLMRDAVVSVQRAGGYVAQAATASALAVDPSARISPNVTGITVGLATATMPNGIAKANIRVFNPASETGSQANTGWASMTVAGNGVPLLYDLTFAPTDLEYGISSVKFRFYARNYNGASVVIKDIFDGSTVAVVVVQNGWNEVDVTSLASSWYDGTKTNSGLRLYASENGAGYGDDEIAMGSNTDQDIRPQLAFTLSNSAPSTHKNISTGVVGTASALFANATPSVEINPNAAAAAQVMTASAAMPGGGFSQPTVVSANAMTAQAESLSTSVTVEDNAIITPAPATASAFLVPALEGQSELFDPYFLRLSEQMPGPDSDSVGDIWFRLDETSGPTAVNRRGSDGIYRGNPTFGSFGPEQRRVVTFDGIDDYIEVAENDHFADYSRMEMVFRTTKATQILATGTDYVLTNNFATNPQKTGLEMIDGRLRILGGGAAYTGRKRVDDGNWHHVVWTNVGGATALYIDGVLDIRRFLAPNRNSIIDAIGGGPDRVGGQQGAYNPALFFQGDIMEFVYDEAGFIPERDITHNFYAVFGIVPVEAGAASATAMMTQSNKGKGNQKRALALYYRTGNIFANGSAPDHVNKYNWTGLATVPTAPFDMAGYKAFPQSIEIGQYDAYGYLGGRFYDEVTGEARFIDVQNDIDASEYDLVFFINTPPLSDEMLSGSMTFSQAFERMMSDLRDAQDEHGFSIWAPQPEVAIGLGVVGTVEYHSMRRGDGRIYGSIDEDGVWGDDHSIGLAPFGFEAITSDPRDYFDTHAINKHRVVAKIDGLTDLGGWIIKDYVYGNKGLGAYFTAPFEAWNLEEKPNGLQIGDELFYPQDFYAAMSSSSWFTNNAFNQRRRVISVPAGAVRAGTVLTRENAQYWERNTLKDNPWRDNAVSIIVQPGDSLNGRPVGGKIFVNFMESLDANQGKLLRQIVPANENISDSRRWENAQQRTWEYSSSRVARSAQTVDGNSVSVPGDDPAALAFKDLLESLNKNSSRLISVNESEAYPVETLPSYSMLFRAFNWLGIREETGDGDKIVRAPAITASAQMVQPSVIAERDTVISVPPAIAIAEIRKPLQAIDGDVRVIILPMSAQAMMTGYGKTIAVAPMEATAEIIENFEIAHASGEQVVLYLHYTDADVFLKEDV